ncbi:MAG: hypothetical protein EPO24_12700 [Bacteroidetes bacterium]|nr:MAG: hypothetical protein EPO24_12700 [Bacteroidota bacterium]
MNTNHVNEQLLAYLSGELDKQQERIVADHLSLCDSCRKEMETINTFWTSLNLIPQVQPSDTMRERFYDMLQDAMEDSAQARLPRKKSRSWLERLFPRPVAIQLGFALLLLLIGGYAGFQFNRQPVEQVQQTDVVNRAEITQLHQEVLAMNRLLAVSLLQQQSASERLRGVSLSYRVEGSDPEIAAALLQALKYDPNVNVRLAALDALTSDREQPSVIDDLLESLPKQSSPLVQIEMVDWILQQREKNSLEVLKQMTKNPMVNKAVKLRIEQGIQELNS